MEWIPIVFVTFKALVLGTGMFYAVKWHYDKENREKNRQMDKRAIVRAAAKVAVIFVLALLALGLLTWFILSKLSLDMNL